MGGGGGGGGGWNPFQDVSMNRPFGNSFVGNALQGNPNAPLTSDGKDKVTGEQYVTTDEDPFNERPDGPGSMGMPVQDPAVAQNAEREQTLQRGREADQAALKAGRQNEADMFTKGMRGARDSSTLNQSLQGLQDSARRVRGRTLYQG